MTTPLKPLAGQHILSAGQFTDKDIETVFQYADNMQKMRRSELLPVLSGKTLACVFYEPSTRTSSSFIAAMGKLGGTVIPITQGVQFSSVSKGETLEDTIQTLGQYADAIVLRHPDTGSVAMAAEVSPVPVINAGDGIGEHPTQALLDLYTIKQEMGRLDNLKVAVVGDLAHGRTVHSLLQLLNRYPGNEFHLVSPWLLRLDRAGGSPLYDEIRPKVAQTYSVKEGLHEASAALEQADVVYMTRVQRERFTYPEQYNDVKNSCLLNRELVSLMKPGARILHPLPRVNEVPPYLDDDPRAAYFRQVKAGLHVRMAVLAAVMGA